MTVEELIDACVQRRYAAWAVLKGSAKPSAGAVEALRRDALALARQVRFEGGAGHPVTPENTPDADGAELRRQLEGLEWLLNRLSPAGEK